MARKKNQTTNARKPTRQRKTAASSTRRTQRTTSVVTKSALEIPTLPHTEEQVRERAYYIYLGRQGRAGDALGDWLQAEQELKRAAKVTRGRSSLTT